MTEPVQFHTRGAVGLSEPTNTSGTPRPKLPMLRPYHTVHYTGILTSQIWFSEGDGIFDDIDEVFEFMRRLEEVARRAGKPFEYNTTIPVMSDNSSHVVAYADEYVAAHSAGNNTTSHGTLIIAGVNQPINDGTVLAFQWWNAVLEASGRLILPSDIREHNEMPGAQTACPGVPIHNRMPELRTPYQAPTIPPPVVVPPTPPTSNGDLMIVVFQPTDCAAEFIGMQDKNGNVLELEWINGAEGIRHRDAHISAGAKIVKGPHANGRFKNCTLTGPIPHGDSITWSASDFHRVRS
jgi:hypothetical protein